MNPKSRAVVRGSHRVAEPHDGFIANNNSPCMQQFAVGFAVWPRDECNWAGFQGSRVIRSENLIPLLQKAYIAERRTGRRPESRRFELSRLFAEKRPQFRRRDGEKFNWCLVAPI
jgi:hypothetical protein